MCEWSPWKAAEDDVRAASGKSGGGRSWSVLSAAASADGLVATISLRATGSAPGLRILRCGRAVVGAIFTNDDAELAGVEGQEVRPSIPPEEREVVFTNFAVLQSASAHLVPKPRRVLVLGLGVGVVPTYLRAPPYSIEVDVVERNEQIIAAAAAHFEYDASFNTQGQRGRTIRADAVDLLMRHDRLPQPAVGAGDDVRWYDVIVHDLFSGASSATLLSAPVVRRIHDVWLTPKTGVLIVNFIGFPFNVSHLNSSVAAAWASTSDGNAAPDMYKLTVSLYRRLRSVFRTVRCFVEAPVDAVREQTARGAPTNIVFIASDRSMVPVSSPAATLASGVAPDEDGGSERVWLRWDMAPLERRLRPLYSEVDWPLQPPEPATSLIGLTSDYVGLHWDTQFEIQIETKTNMASGIAGGTGSSHANDNKIDGQGGTKYYSGANDEGDGSEDDDLELLVELQRRVDSLIWQHAVRPILPPAAWADDLRAPSTPVNILKTSQHQANGDATEISGGSQEQQRDEL